MKSVIYALISISLLAGCSQPKNRLADLKNKEYQKRLSEKAKSQGLTPTDSSQTPVTDISTDTNMDSDVASPSQLEVQVPKQKDSSTDQSEPSKESPVLVAPAERAPMESSPQAVAPQTTAPQSTTKAPTEKKQTETQQKEVSLKDEDEKPSSQDKTSKAKAKTETSDTAKSSAPQAQADQSNPTDKQATPDKTTSEKPTIQPDADPSYLTFEEYYASSLILQEAFGDNARAIVSPFQSDGTMAQIALADQKLSLSYGQAGRILAEVKDIDLNYGDSTNRAANGYDFVGLCTTPECGIFFATLYKVENEQINFNYPLFLKKIDGQYVKGQFHPQEFYKKEFERLKAELEKQKGTAAAGQKK